LARVNERIARLDGSVREVEIALAAMPDHGRTTLQMVINDVTEQARASRELRRSRRELRELTASLVDAREEERRRIARELHDELGQRLTALKLELSTLDASAVGARPSPRIATMFEMIDETVAAVRRIATDLRPAMLDDLGLNTAVEWLARDSARRMGLQLSLDLPPVDPPIGDAASIALYRMVQETLTNIARHARATQVRIDMRCDDAAVELRVQDNGVGLPKPPSRRKVSHGLMGMRERCQMLGGTIELGNAPDGGACITIRLPLLAQLQTGAAGAAGELGDGDAPTAQTAQTGHGWPAGGDAAPDAAGA
jgi:signal transduction histidine kinase